MKDEFELFDTIRINPFDLKRERIMCDENGNLFVVRVDGAGNMRHVITTDKINYDAS